MPVKRTHEEFVKLAKEKHPKVRVLGIYQGSVVKIECRCGVCKTKWTPFPNTFLQGHGCPTCARNAKLGLTDAEYKARVKQINPNLRVLEPYNGRFHKIRHRCTACSKDWITSPDRIFQTTGCPDCALARRLLQNRFRTYTAKVHGKTVEYQGYELYALRWIIRTKRVGIEDIAWSKQGTVPMVPYMEKGKRRNYFPDFYIASINRIVEVKSAYTLMFSKAALENNRRKALACKAKGFKFTMLIADRHGNCKIVPKKWLTCSMAELRELVN